MGCPMHRADLLKAKKNVRENLQMNFVAMAGVYIEF